MWVQSCVGWGWWAELGVLRSMGPGIAGGVASNVGMMCGGGVSLRVCCV